MRPTLYILLTAHLSKRPLLDAARAALDGGADALQLREKDVADRFVLDEGAALRRLTERYGALLFVNDRPDLALLVGADGCHVGQDDLPVWAARKAMGEGMKVGVSTHSEEQARAAAEAGADYVAVGPMYPTETKGYAAGVGPALARAARPHVKTPLVAIGGIVPERVAEVVEAGADCIAVCSAVISAEDPRAEAERFRKEMDAALKRRGERREGV